MENQFSRTELLLGSSALKHLQQCHVAVFGLGGVGGYTVEALARAGVGALDLIDNDIISVSNINRQLLATHKTIGLPKVDVAAQRIKTINPSCKVVTKQLFYLPEKSADFTFEQYDYIIDAVDTVSAKLSLAEAAVKANVPIISAMGAGNKLDPTAFMVADIFDTVVCPLAHVMRKELKKRGIKKLKVVYSQEKPLKPQTDISENNAGKGKRTVPGSISFVPPVVGLIMAGEVIKDLLSDT